MRGCAIQLIVVAALHLGCVPSGSAQDADVDANIYLAVLTQVEDFKKRSQLLIGKTTTPPFFLGGVKTFLQSQAPREFAEAHGELVEELVRVNTLAKEIPATVKDSLQHEFLDNESLDQIFKDGSTAGWKHIYGNYKGVSGLVRFSRASFNPALTQALVFVSYSCGRLCGEGYLVLLERQQASWLVKRRLSIWIS